MGDVIDMKGYFKEVPGLVLCLACGHTHAGLVPGSAPVNGLECDHCHSQESVFISRDALLLVLGER